MPDSRGRITLWAVEVFVAAAEEGSVSAAARRLGASTSGVSQTVTALEEAVGVSLMDRSTRPITLTPAGETFVVRARAILAEAAAAQAELAGADLSHLTRLRLGMIEDFDADVTPRLLQDMAGDLDNCQFLLETGASHRLLDLLETRALDIIVTADLGATGDWMEVWPLLEEPFLVAAPKGQIDPSGDVAAQLMAKPMIMYTQRHHMGRQISAHLARQNLRLITRFEIDSYHAILAMVAGRAGWTILTPLGLARAHRFRDDVDVMAMPFRQMTRTISLIARRDILQDMPAAIAERLRGHLSELVVAPAEEAWPWIAGDLRVLGR